MRCIRVKLGELVRVKRWRKNILTPGKEWRLMKQTTRNGLSRASDQKLAHIVRSVIPGNPGEGRGRPGIQKFKESGYRPSPVRRLDMNNSFVDPLGRTLKLDEDLFCFIAGELLDRRDSIAELFQSP